MVVGEDWVVGRERDKGKGTCIFKWYLSACGQVSYSNYNVDHTGRIEVYNKERVFMYVCEHVCVCMHVSMCVCVCVSYIHNSLNCV